MGVLSSLACLSHGLACIYIRLSTDRQTALVEGFSYTTPVDVNHGSRSACPRGRQEFPFIRGRSAWAEQPFHPILWKRTVV
jgi:hypothetical protein